MKTIQTEIPEQLYKEILTLVKQGWFRNEKDVYSAAIRRFLDTHRPELMEKFIRDDVEWGLHGNDLLRGGKSDKLLTKWEGRK